MDTISSIAFAQAAACVVGSTWNIREPLTAIRSPSPTPTARQLSALAIPGDVHDSGADAGLYLELVHEPTSLILAARRAGASPVGLGDDDQHSEDPVALLVSGHVAASSVPWRSLSPTADSFRFPSRIEHPALGPIVVLAVAHAKAPCSKRKQGPPGTKLSHTRTKQSTGSALGQTIAMRPLVAAPVPTLLARIFPRPPAPLQVPYLPAAPHMHCSVCAPSSQRYDGDASQMWCDSSSQMAPSYSVAASWRPDPGPGRNDWTPTHEGHPTPGARTFSDCDVYNDYYNYNDYNGYLSDYRGAEDSVVTTQAKADGDSAALSTNPADPGAADMQAFCPPVVALLVLPIYGSSVTSLSNPILVPLPGAGPGAPSPLSALFTSSYHPGLQVAPDSWHTLSSESSHIRFF